MTEIDFFRHTLATIAYRAGHSIRTAPQSFAEFKAGASSKTPLELVAHMTDLLDWSLTELKGESDWHERPPTNWETDVARFYDSLKKLDGYAAAGHPTKTDLMRLFQGPMVGCFVYIGRIDMLRRRHGSPVKREIFFEADIVIGRVGPQQTPPRMELEQE
jgi:hypothetical protein